MLAIAIAQRRCGASFAPVRPSPYVSVLSDALPQQMVLTRGLRAGRRRLPRTQEPMAAAPVAALPVATLPPLIRVRDFAKRLKLPLDDVLKRIAVRRDRRLHVEDVDGRKYEFRTVKQVILPFPMAQRVAADYGKHVVCLPTEPDFMDAHSKRKLRQSRSSEWVRRPPVIAVMGHVDHGKTTLLDTMRGSSVAAREVEGITQQINVCEAQLTPTLQATFLDTPGHFHFFRMRTNAAQVADLILLIVAANEGCLLQTEESIGAIEETGIPSIACINKIDVATPSEVTRVQDELRSYVALQTCPIVAISASEGTNLDALMSAIEQLVQSSAKIQHRLEAFEGEHGGIEAEGVVFETLAVRGRGNVLRVLLKHGKVQIGDHFIAGMIHGVVRSVRDVDGEERALGCPGHVVDVMYKRLSKHLDAPLEFGFFVLSPSRAKEVMEQRELRLELAESEVEGLHDQENLLQEQASLEDQVGLRAEEGEERVPTTIIVKADGGGSLASIQDTVDDMDNVSTVRMGIGDITLKDIDVAHSSGSPIFAFKVKFPKREQRRARSRGVRVIQSPTIHGLIAEIQSHHEQNEDPQ